MTTPALRYFGYEHLPKHLQAASGPCSELAWAMNALLPDSPEKSAGMRKLLEAKDCFVRAALDAESFVTPTETDDVDPDA